MTSEQAHDVTATPRRRKREPNPFAVIENIRLHDEPRRLSERLLRISDYEIITAQAWEIARLRMKLAEAEQ